MDWNLADLFEAVADSIPDRTALVCRDRRLTFAELDQRSNRLAHHLAGNLGVGPGDHVGLHMLNGVEWVESMVACLKARAVPVNVNYRYVEDELRYLYDDADLGVAVVAREFAGRVPPGRQLMVVEDDYEPALAAASPERDFGSRSADDLYIIYTGGTTGMPKGVMWRQEDLFFAGLGGGNPGGEPLSAPEQVGPSVAARQPGASFPLAPLMHGAAQLATWIGFFWGAKVVLLPRFDAEEILRTIEGERVDTVNLVGDAMARPLGDALDAPGADYDLSSLVVVSSAGAILSESVRRQLEKHLPNVFIIDGFGASETGFQGTRSGPSFAMNDRTAVLGDDLRPVEPGSGVVGRVAQRRHIPLGYYKDEEKTARTFVEVGGERWVLPGDMATVEADGTIRVLGRGSVCVNTGGEKVYPEEVEAVLKGHPAVFDAVVVGVPDPRWGERVTAVVQSRPGHDVSPAELEAHCRDRLAGYKVPRSVFFVPEVVRSPSGKPDYPWARSKAVEQDRSDDVPLDPEGAPR
jgi:acyl-CoA synthetase (AMP-forming)/AMP-acid ligase II